MLGCLLDRQPSHRGRRVAIVGNAGGPLILAADAAEEAGAVVPVFGAALQGRLTRLAESAPAVANPVDIGPSAASDSLASVVHTVAASGEVDACVAVCVELDEHQHDATLARLESAEVDVPVAVTAISGRSRPTGRFPTFPTPERAATAVALAGERAGPPDGGQSNGLGVDAVSLIAARSFARRLAHHEQATTWLEQRAAFELLESAGVHVAPWCFATSVEEVVQCLRRLESPLVIKASVADIRHKTEARAVRLGIVDAAAAAHAYADLSERFDDRLDGVIVQSQVPAGLELQIVGGRDAALGPFVTVGAGGVDSELRADQSMLVAPVTAAEARAAVERLHLAPLFSGFRSRPALPIDPVVDLVTRIAALLAAVPEVRQIDLNPVIVGAPGCVPVDARIGLSRPESLVTPTRAMRGALPSR